MTTLFVAGFGFILVGFVCLAVHYAKTSKPFVLELHWLVTGWVCVLLGGVVVVTSVVIQDHQWQDKCRSHGGVVQNGSVCVKPDSVIHV